MGLFKKNRAQKMPGNQNTEMAKAQQAVNKENERKQMLYGIFRTIFEMQCISLGLEEVAVMSYEQGGCMPRVARQPFDPAEAEKRIEYMQARLKDFHAMSKSTGGSLVDKALTFLLEEMDDIRIQMKEVDSPPKAPNAAGLVGADGNELDSTKKNDEVKEEETTDEETIEEGDGGVDEALQEETKQA